MKIALRALKLVPALASLVAAGGCGRSFVPSYAAGATIQGTVASNAGAAQALRVSVPATAAATTTDAAGHFVLSSVPVGNQTLRFQGAGVDASLRISGLHQGDKLTVTVRVSGSEAALEGDEEAELSGTITAIDPTAKTLTVDKDRTVTTDSHTEFEGLDDAALSFSDLKVGDNVHVEGAMQSDGSVLATQIELRNDAEPPEQIEFKGTITAIDTTAHTLQVGDHTVVIGTDTNCEGQVHSCADLNVGDLVEVKGTVSGANVQAQEINKIGPEEPPDVELRGTIKTVAAPDLTVTVFTKDVTVHTDANTKIEQAGVAILFPALMAGDTVEVEGTLQSDGSVLASRIQVAPMEP